ncbi:MAG: nicotinate-nucleotide--dimethylbenzimidazole phosphoribosyltransferase, partial [Deltaproteobacteria bacterium]
ASHISVEKAHQAALSHLGLNPILDLEMRLGEGCGAALVIDLADSACRIMREMASFDEAGVAKKKKILS